MNLHVDALKRSANNVIRNWLTSGRLMAICVNVRPEYLVPGLDLFDERGVKRPLPCPLARYALRLHGPRRFRRMSRLPNSYYLGVEDRFVPLSEVGPGATKHVVVVRHVHRALANRIQRSQTANRLAYPRVWNAEMERLFDVWVQHVDLLIEEPAGVAGIHFDRRWLVDRQYRLEIGQKLGLQRPGNRP